MAILLAMNTTRRPHALLLAITLLALAGCGGRVLMPTPAVYWDIEEDVFAGVPESRRSNVVEVLYVTDRKADEIDDDGNVTYGALRSKSLGFGVTRVQIGDDDLDWETLCRVSQTKNRDVNPTVKWIGATELVRTPEWPWYVNLQHNPSLTEEDVEAQMAVKVQEVHSVIAEKIAEADKRTVYVFVHGFNNTFAYASESIAELWHISGRPGLAILYSWPAARAGIFGYDADRESSEFTVSHLKRFLEFLARCEEIENINVISHSRGTDVLASALRELRIKYDGMGVEPTEALKIDNAVFLAADIDMEVANQRLGGEEIYRVADHLTIYTGAEDKALNISAKMFKSESRIGQMNPETVTAWQQKTWELFEDRFSVIHRPTKTGFLGHGYYLDDPSVSSDIMLLLRYGRLPGAENGRPLIKDPTGIWIMPDDYPNNEVPAAE
jgi:esterase/lipase superfamily enzyme